MEYICTQKSCKSLLTNGDFNPMVKELNFYTHEITTFCSVGRMTVPNNISSTKFSEN